MAKQETGETPQAPKAMSKKYRLKAGADGSTPAAMIHPVWGVPISNKDLESSMIVAALQKEDKKRNKNFFASNVEEVNG